MRNSRTLKTTTVEHRTLAWNITGQSESTAAEGVTDSKFDTGLVTLDMRPKPSTSRIDSKSEQEHGDNGEGVDEKEVV
jgi:hypothetical protein